MTLGLSKAQGLAEDHPKEELLDEERRQRDLPRGVGPPESSQPFRIEGVRDGGFTSSGRFSGS